MGIIKLLSHNLVNEEEQIICIKSNKVICELLEKIVNEINNNCDCDCPCVCECPIISYKFIIDSVNDGDTSSSTTTNWKFLINWGEYLAIGLVII